VLDRQARTPVVTCFVKKPNTSSFTTFGAVHTSVKAEGDNGNCQVDSSVMNEQGDYEFKVSAVSGSDSEESLTVTVKYDTSGPGTPNYFSKEHPSLCRWIIKFHTADDAGATTKVEIYSSDQKTFDTNNGTRVGTVNIGSNQDGSFTHDRGDSCDREWYYVIRAFDAAGNQSDYRGDEVVISLTSSTSTTSTAPALVVATGNGNVLGKEDDQADVDQTGEVLGEEKTVIPETVEGTGLVVRAKNIAGNIGKSKFTWWIVGMIIVLGTLYVIARKKKTQ
jgi:hypothetical protein